MTEPLDGGMMSPCDDVLTAWWDGEAAGAENMAADEMLAAEAARLGRPLMRFYRWHHPSVSLGGFQAITEARSTASIAGVPLVRRPSGGGALVHGTDLTYALAVPRGHPWARSPEPLYDAVHAALVAELAARGVVARRHAGHPAAANEAFFCFSRRAAGDVVAAWPRRALAADDPKILGSAQRRLAAAIVQHGSLLLETNRGVGAAARHLGLAEIGVGDVVAPLQPFAAAWVERIAAPRGLGVDWRPESFLAGRGANMATAAAKFLDVRWLERR
jgi:lipoate-protein ligase A